MAFRYMIFHLSFATIASAFGADSSRSYEYCDEGSTPFDKAVSSLTPNTIHKICSGTLPESTPLGQTICGDGTAFSFFYGAPSQRYSNDKKIIIEFLGGEELILEVILKNICDLL
jgi:hypothetical protein